MRRYIRAMNLFIISSLVLISCNGDSVCSCKKVSCPAYSNSNFDQWFPYKSSQQLLFTDTSRRLPDDTIIISSTTATESYEANRGCYNGASGCTANKYIYSPDMSANYSSSTEWDNSSGDSSYIFTLHDFTTTATGINSAGFVNTSYPSSHYNSLNLNGKNYDNVQTIMRTDTTGAGYDVYQVYLQKGKGLIAWRSQYANTLFVLK